MAKKPAKKPQPPQKPRVNKELEGFDIEINSFGEIKTAYDIDKINQFLNRTVDDKKLRHRDDLDELKRHQGEEERNLDSEDSKD
jgi:hypothetical protein